MNNIPTSGGLKKKHIDHGLKTDRSLVTFWQSFLSGLMQCAILRLVS